MFGHSLGKKIVEGTINKKGETILADILKVIPFATILTFQKIHEQMRVGRL